MKQDLILTGKAATRIAYLVSAFTTDMITETESVELNNWLENNPENCAIFEALTVFPKFDLHVSKTTIPGNFRIAF